MDQPVCYFDVRLDLTPSEAVPVSQGELVGPAPSLAQIKALQDGLLELAGGETWEGEPQHFFADGMYGRVLPISAGMVVVGKMHRHEHLVMLMSGTCRITTAQGVQEFTGPHVWVSKPGEKRALVTLTDCVFMTTHLNPTNTRDLGAIEADVIVPEAEIDYGPARIADFTDDLQRMYA